MVSVRATTKAAAEKREKRVRKKTNGRMACGRRRMAIDGGNQGVSQMWMLTTLFIPYMGRLLRVSVSGVRTYVGSSGSCSATATAIFEFEGGVMPANK